MPTENPNEREDDAYAEGKGDLRTAFYKLWDAGATLDNIREEVTSALQTVTDSATIRAEFFDA